ncbi:MAG: ATP-dependent exoDNAse (exonuclease V) alpha subunit [Myxococcota bacterium]|jgi:ATP-dependent exoDNAse (exonuclease V) alpha subunit
MSIKLLSKEQKEAVYAIEDGESIFVSGSAGTGKSYLLQYLKTNYSDHGLHITASTGIAAVNVGGQTLHSWAAIGLGNLPAEQIIENLFSAKFSRVRRKLKLAKMLAIDEISMISAPVFDLINELLKAIRQNDKPFGGLQLILFGDFLQLPPINRDGQMASDYQFCFQSKAWKELDPRSIMLKTVFRQADQNFVNLLNNIRFGKLSDEDLDILQSRINLPEQNSAIRPTILASHNAQVDAINRVELQKIVNSSKVFSAKFSGNPTKKDFLRKNCLAPESMELKVGAQVMMLKNTYQKEGIINGSLGIIQDFSKKTNHPIVRFNNGVLLTIAPEIWALEKFDVEKREIVTEAEMSQVPLLLAWAMTIHKSQGMTLDKVKCDLSKVFADGQIYVALSRVKTLEGLYIDGIDFNRIRANSDIVNFYNQIGE